MACDCLGGRVRAVTEPLGFFRDTHILQYVETVNAPADGAGRRGPVAPLNAVPWLFFYSAEISTLTHYYISIYLEI